MIGKSDDLTTLKTLTSTLERQHQGLSRVGRNRSKARNSASCSPSSPPSASRPPANLKAEVRRLGGEPDQDGSTLGSLHQTWLDLKSAITGRDDKAIINEVERGEDYLKGKFETALNDGDLAAASAARWSSAPTSRSAKGTTR